jgi:hypothetical protein
MSAVLAVRFLRGDQPWHQAGGIKAYLRIVQEKGLATTGGPNHLSGNSIIHQGELWLHLSGLDI